MNKNLSCLVAKRVCLRIFESAKSGDRTLMGTLPTADSWYRKPSPRLCPGLYKY